MPHLHGSMLGHNLPGIPLDEFAPALALSGNEGVMKLVSIYSPTFGASNGDIDSFWAAIRAETSSSGMVVVLGDFNARVGNRPRVVGARAADDQDFALGFHGTGACNEMGQRMLDFCQTERLRVTNTYYPHSIANKASWYHPGSRNPGLLDYALVRTVDAAFVTNCRRYPNPNVDVDSDHVLGILDMRQRPCARAPRVAGPAPPAGRLPQPTRRLEVAPLRALQSFLRCCTNAALHALDMLRALPLANGKFLSETLSVLLLANAWRLWRSFVLMVRSPVSSTAGSQSESCCSTSHG